MSIFPLHTPWWLRIEWPWRPRATAPAPRTTCEDHEPLLELDVRTLHDIGAPDALLARAHARREARLHERGALALGVAAGAWRHW